MMTEEDIEIAVDTFVMCATCFRQGLEASLIGDLETLEKVWRSIPPLHGLVPLMFPQADPRVWELVLCFEPMDMEGVERGPDGRIWLERPA